MRHGTAKPPAEAKDSIRERLEKDMARFFGNGGKITKIPRGVSGEVIKPPINRAKDTAQRRERTGRR